MNISKVNGDGWNTESAFGNAKIRLRPSKESGIFDHDYVAQDREVDRVLSGHSR